MLCSMYVAFILVSIYMAFILVSDNCYWPILCITTLFDSSIFNISTDICSVLLLARSSPGEFQF